MKAKTQRQLESITLVLFSTHKRFIPEHKKRIKLIAYLGSERKFSSGHLGRALPG